MSKGKKSRFAALGLGLAGVVALVGLWLSLSPLPPAAPPQAVSVPVMTPPPELAPTLAPPLPTPETVPAPLGDERAQSESVTSAPPPPPPSSPLSAATHRPRIALVIDDMGLDLKDSRRAVALPATVTLSYIPYASQLKSQTDEAADAGHELLLHMPMEPVGHDDPGPGALLTNLPPDEIRARFQAALGRFTSFDGVNNHMGSKFTADATGMAIVMDELHARGLFFFDSRTSAQSVGAALAHARGVPSISRDVFLDNEITPGAVAAQLAALERIARQRGFAVAIGHPHAVTLQVLEDWLPAAQARGVTLVRLRDLVKGSE